MAPGESPTRLQDVKRALLTFDRVYLSDPNDRDLIPPQLFLSAVGAPPLISSFMGFNGGPVRPLGKIPSYDDEFDDLLTHLRPAISDGLVEVVSSYDLQSSQKNTIGKVFTGDFPLNERFLLSAFQASAKEQSLLSAALYGDSAISIATDDLISSIAVTDTLGDSSDMPLLHGTLSRDHLRKELTAVARARIGATIKAIGYCASKNIVPIFNGYSYNNIASQLASKAADVIDKVGEADPYWVNRRRALDIAHEEYLEMTTLDAMTVNDVLSLRSKAWGRHAEVRDDLFEAIAHIARDIDIKDNFNKLVSEKIMEYRKTFDDIKLERRYLSFNVTCDIITAIATAALSAITDHVVKNIFTQIPTAMGAGTVLLGGCIYGTQKIKDIKSVTSHLYAAEREFKDNACFGMHNFYRSIGRSVGDFSL